MQLSELNDPEDKIQVHGSSLYASLDDMQANGGLREFNPDVGYYFDAGWGKVVTWPNRFIAWRDMGLPDNLDFTIDMLQESHKNIMEGRTVEIGCVGGKGRTGTFMALLMWWHERVVHDYYRESGQYYIDRVREEYLPEAIETLQQEEYIKSIVGHQP